MHCTLIDDCLAASEDVKDYRNSRGSTNSSQQSYTTYLLSLRYWEIRSCIWGESAVRVHATPCKLACPCSFLFEYPRVGSLIIASLLYMVTLER
jgi:diacylglycerol kinase